MTILIEIYRHVNSLMQYCHSDHSEHVLVTYMNNVTRTCKNTQISNDGGEESIAFLGETQLAATSLCSLPSSRNGE